MASIEAAATFACRLFPQAQLGDDLPVAIRGGAGQVLEKTVPLANHPEQTPAGGVVLLVRLEMAGEVVDPSCQQRNLHLRRPCVAFVNAILLDDLILHFLCDAHNLERTWTPLGYLPTERRTNPFCFSFSLFFLLP